MKKLKLLLLSLGLCGCSLIPEYDPTEDFSELFSTKFYENIVKKEKVSFFRMKINSCEYKKIDEIKTIPNKIVFLYSNHTFKEYSSEKMYEYFPPVKKTLGTDLETLYSIKIQEKEDFLLSKESPLGNYTFFDVKAHLEWVNKKNERIEKDVTFFENTEAICLSSFTFTKIQAELKLRS